MNIEIQGLTKTYRSAQALTDVSLTLSPGVHGLLGPNGAGKSTLIRIMATILEPSSGSIEWGDNLSWKRTKDIKGKVGYLPQTFGMYKYLRVEEALKHVALLKDIPSESERKQINLAMEKTNLMEFSKRKVGELSGGMLRRLGIAQAILGEPKLLLLDEPSVGLDPAERISLRKLIRDYAKLDRIVLISSHIVNDVESLCDKVSIMSRGRLLMSGTVPEINAKASLFIREEIMSADKLRETEAHYAVIDFTPVDGGYKVRYLANEQMQNAVANISLEDSYTYIIQRNQAL